MKLLISLPRLFMIYIQPGCTSPTTILGQVELSSVMTTGFSQFHVAIMTVELVYVLVWSFEKSTSCLLHIMRKDAIVIQAITLYVKQFAHTSMALSGTDKMWLGSVL